MLKDGDPNGQGNENLQDKGVQSELSPVDDLVGEGFTIEEAHRLIDITARIERSEEAREAEATRRRLQFTRWLLDHGRLDEWST